MIFSLTNRVRWGIMVGILLTLTNVQYAQDAAVAVPTTADTSPQMVFKKHIIAGIGAGSQALVGIDVAYQFSRTLAVRVGYGYFSYEASGLKPDLSSFSLPKGKISIGTGVNQSNLNLAVEYSPTKKGRIRLFAGANYFPNLNYSLMVKYDEAINLGEIVVAPDEIGTMTVKYTTTSPITPCAGIGFGRLAPRKRIGLNVDLGAAYRGAPQIDVEATKLLAGNTENGAILTRNAKSYQWFPMANLRLTIKLN